MPDRSVPIGASLVPANWHRSRRVPVLPVIFSRDPFSDRARYLSNISRLNGAGEGIRTPDPNLGKGVLTDATTWNFSLFLPRILHGVTSGGHSVTVLRERLNNREQPTHSVNT